VKTFEAGDVAQRGLTLPPLIFHLLAGILSREPSTEVHTRLVACMEEHAGSREQRGCLFLGGWSSSDTDLRAISGQHLDQDTLCTAYLEDDWGNLLSNFGNVEPEADPGGWEAVRLARGLGMKPTNERRQKNKVPAPFYWTVQRPPPAWPEALDLRPASDILAQVQLRVRGPQQRRGGRMRSPEVGGGDDGNERERVLSIPQEHFSDKTVLQRLEAVVRQLATDLIHTSPNKKEWRSDAHVQFQPAEASPELFTRTDLRPIFRAAWTLPMSGEQMAARLVGHLFPDQARVAQNLNMHQSTLLYAQLQDDVRPGDDQARVKAALGSIVGQMSFMPYTESDRTWRTRREVLGRQWRAVGQPVLPTDTRPLLLVRSDVAARMQFGPADGVQEANLGRAEDIDRILSQHRVEHDQEWDPDALARHGSRPFLEADLPENPTEAVTASARRSDRISAARAGLRARSESPLAWPGVPEPAPRARPAPFAELFAMGPVDEDIADPVPPLPPVAGRAARWQHGGTQAGGSRSAAADTSSVRRNQSSRTHSNRQVGGSGRSSADRSSRSPSLFEHLKEEEEEDEAPIFSSISNPGATAAHRRREGASSSPYPRARRPSGQPSRPTGSTRPAPRPTGGAPRPMNPPRPMGPPRPMNPPPRPVNPPPRPVNPPPRPMGEPLRPTETRFTTPARDAPTALPTTSLNATAVALSVLNQFAVDNTFGLEQLHRELITRLGSEYEDLLPSTWNQAITSVSFLPGTPIGQKRQAANRLRSILGVTSPTIEGGAGLRMSETPSSAPRRQSGPPTVQGGAGLRMSQTSTPAPGRQSGPRLGGTTRPAVEMTLGAAGRRAVADVGTARPPLANSRPASTAAPAGPLPKRQPPPAASTSASDAVPFIDLRQFLPPSSIRPSPWRASGGNGRAESTSAGTARSFSVGSERVRGVKRAGSPSGASPPMSRRK
jgi:hypothetical protein